MKWITVHKTATDEMIETGRRAMKSTESPAFIYSEMCRASPQPKAGLTARQRQLLDLLREYWRANPDAISPSYEELATALGVSSLSTVHKMISALVRRGHLVSTGGKRSIRLRSDSNEV